MSQCFDVTVCTEQMYNGKKNIQKKTTKCAKIYVCCELRAVKSKLDGNTEGSLVAQNQLNSKSLNSSEWKHPEEIK